MSGVGLRDLGFGATGLRLRNLVISGFRVSGLAF